MKTVIARISDKDTGIYKKSRSVLTEKHSEVRGGWLRASEASLARKTLSQILSAFAHSDFALTQPGVEDRSVLLTHAFGAYSCQEVTEGPDR